MEYASPTETIVSNWDMDVVSFVTSLATSVNIPIQETNTFHHVSTSDLQSGNVYEALRDPDVLLQVGELKKDL